jgi:hypothetical protein
MTWAARSGRRAARADEKKDREVDRPSRDVHGVDHRVDRPSVEGPVEDDHGDTAVRDHDSEVGDTTFGGRYCEQPSGDVPIADRGEDHEDHFMTVEDHHADSEDHSENVDGR